MIRRSISRCKKSSHVILRFQENLLNAGGQLELLASIFESAGPGDVEQTGMASYAC